MIISRTPFRVSLGGGGTDLPSYYRKFGASLVTAAVDKYVYIMVHRRFENNIKVGYSKTEIVDSIDKIEHPVVREALRLMNIRSNIEIVTMADAPSNTGLGTSSSFTVGLLSALHAYKRESISLKTLAEEACNLEQNILKEAVGKQDQYAATYGGLICLDISRRGEVTVFPLKINPADIAELESNLLFFYTGIRRGSADIQSDHQKAIERNEERVIETLHKIDKIGREIKRALELGAFDKFGELLNEHWKVKKNLSVKISNPRIDRWYNRALKSGALGGKIMGAGGGGFFMFYCKDGTRDRLRKSMLKEGLQEIRFRFETTGSKIIANI